MISSDFTVQYIDVADCFIYLSSSMCQAFKIRNVEIIADTGVKAFVTISSTPYSIENKVIGINPLFGQVLKIQEQSKVILKTANNLSSLKSVSLVTLSENDFIVLSNLNDIVENSLLNFINVVSVGQKIILWPTKIVAFVENADPVSTGFLQNNTELEILPPTNVSREKNEQKHLQNEPKIKSRIKARVLPINYTSMDTILEEPFNIFIWNGSLLDKSLINNTIYKITPLISNNAKLKKQTFYGQLCILDDYYNQFSDMEKIYVNENLIKTEHYESIFVQNSIMTSCQLKFGSKAILDPISKINISEIKLNSIKVFIPSGYQVDKFKFELESFFMNKISVFISSSILFRLKNDLICYFLLDPVDFAFITLDILNRLMEIEIDLNLCVSDYKDKETQYNNSGIYFDNLFLNYKNDVLSLIKCCLKLNNCNHKFFPENCIISGNTGSGVSTLCHRIVMDITHSPYFIKTKIIKCKENYGKSLTTLNKIFSKTFLKLKHYQPSLLILEDVQFLCGESLSNENQLYFNRITILIRTFIESFQQNNCIFILATCDSVTNLNKNIYSARGVNLFPHVFNVPELTKHDKENVIKFLLDNRSIKYDKSIFNKFPRKLDGFVVQDVVDFVNKLTYETIKNNCDRQLTLEILKKSLDQFKPLKLFGINSNENFVKNLTDIGGLKTAKNVLIETIEWPIKYPEIFQEAPIRVQSGILLYGPPGTGKTFLANAIAKHFNIHLITIKGPELLSKFVGASEQAVRNVFEKAQSAKPCILFFDEFDSLAPRRGNDHIGVTDRVVNQFLTQLDGVETLNGVYVIAATSRPDLIDPALLRPGRLDKHVYCNIPTEEDRYEILENIKKNYDVNEDVDIGKLAKVTQNFTGADLQSLFYTAQLEILESNLKNNDIQSNATNKISLKMENIFRAFEVAKSDLKHFELANFEKIYAKFQKDPLNSNIDFKQKITQA